VSSGVSFLTYKLERSSRGKVFSTGIKESYTRILRESYSKHQPVVDKPQPRKSEDGAEYLGESGALAVEQHREAGRRADCLFALSFVR
jgi:hypothetical protein